MDKQDETAFNDNHSFTAMTRNPDRQFADQAITLTIEGLFDRGVSLYDVAKSLFDMALSLAPGNGTSDDDTENWWYLLEYFHDTTSDHHKRLKEALLQDKS